MHHGGEEGRRCCCQSGLLIDFIKVLCLVGFVILIFLLVGLFPLTWNNWMDIFLIDFIFPLFGMIGIGVGIQGVLIMEFSLFSLLVY